MPYVSQPGGGGDSFFVEGGTPGILQSLTYSIELDDGVVSFEVINEAITTTLTTGVQFLFGIGPGGSTALAQYGIYAEATGAFIGTAFTGPLAFFSSFQQFVMTVDGSTSCFEVDTAGSSRFAFGLAVGQSAAAPAILDNGTIDVTDVVEIRLAPAAARTGIIMEAGTKPGQLAAVINQSAAINSLTFAVAGTSRVAEGVSCVIAGLKGKLFCWNSVTSLWYALN